MGIVYSKIFKCAFCIILVLCFSGCGIQSGDEQQSASEASVSTDAGNVEQEAIEKSQSKGEFQGLKESYPQIKWGNHIMNLKQTISGLVCPDENGTWYVNCGRDDFLYYLKEGTVQKKLEAVVTSLNIWEGNLYFVLHEDGDILGMGAICRWNPETNHLETLVEKDVWFCRVKEDGIYFAEGSVTNYENGGYSISPTYKFLSFSDGTVTSHDLGKWDQYGNYVSLALWDGSAFSGIVLKNLKGDENIQLYSATGRKYLIDDCIWNGYFYALENSNKKFVQINLESGECKTISSPFYLYDYNEIGGQIFFSVGGNSLAKWNSETEEWSEIRVTNSESHFESLEEAENSVNNKKIGNYEELYTDGTNLYALVHYYSSEEYVKDEFLLVQLTKEGGIWREKNPCVNEERVENEK